MLLILFAEGEMGMVTAAGSQVDNTPIAVETLNLGHFFLREFKVEQIGILADPFLFGRLRNDENTVLDGPAKSNLGSGLENLSFFNPSPIKQTFPCF